MRFYSRQHVLRWVTERLSNTWKVYGDCHYSHMVRKQVLRTKRAAMANFRREGA